MSEGASVDVSCRMRGLQSICNFVVCQFVTSVNAVVPRLPDLSVAGGIAVPQYAPGTRYCIRGQLGSSW
jgi:hypothetical protein